MDSDVTIHQCGRHQAFSCLASLFSFIFQNGAKPARRSLRNLGVRLHRGRPMGIAAGSAPFRSASPKLGVGSRSNKRTGKRSCQSITHHTRSFPLFIS